jgi:hypothetical protein
MPSEAAIFEQWTGAAQYFLNDEYMGAIKDLLILDHEHPLLSRCKERADVVDGLTALIRWKTSLGFSFRPISERGYTPTGAPRDSARQSFTLRGHAAALQVTLHELQRCNGKASAIGNLLTDKMDDIVTVFPHYKRLLWMLPSSGVLGVAASIATTTVTLVNTGLWNTHAYDLNKRFLRGMWVQVLTSAGVARGGPVRVEEVERDANGAGDTIVLSSDPGVQATDLLVITDIGGLEHGYNQFGPGLLDIIDDDNTFQGTNRATTGNQDFRAYVQGSAGAVTYATLSAFFARMDDPKEAFTTWPVIDAYFKNELRANVRFNGTTEFVDGARSVTIGSTRLIADKDLFSDRIIVPDFANMALATKGGLENPWGEGWRRVQGRIFAEYVLAFFGLPFAEDCRKMGVLSGIDPTL